MSVRSGPLLSRRSLQLALILAPSFIATGAQSTTSTSSSARSSHSQSADDEDTDDDGEDGDNSSTRTHSSTSSSRLSATGSASSTSSSATSSTISDGSSKRGLQGGSIVAIVFGILVLLLIVGALLLFWWRRRRRQLAATSANDSDGSQVNTALISKNPVTIPSPTHPTSPNSNSIPWIPPVYMAAPPNDHASDPEHGDQSQDHHGRTSSSIHTLPNPHDSYRDVPQSRTSTMRTTSMHSDRDLPPLPDSPVSLRPTSTSSSLFGALSAAPSSFAYPVLSHVPESESAASTTTSSDAGPSSSSTGTEAAIMADYQKRLESHHRKESEDAAGGSGIPVDPPPRYSESDQTHRS